MTDTAAPVPPASPAATAPAAGCPIAPFLPHAVLAGAFLGFVAFFLPWWGLTGAPEDRPGLGNVAQVKTPGLLAKNASWYTTYAVWDRFQKERDARLDAARQGEVDKVEQISISIRGLDTGPGVVAFIYFFLVVAIVLGPVFVPMLGRRGPIGPGRQRRGVAGPAGPRPGRWGRSDGRAQGPPRPASRREEIAALATARSSS
ncbi:MAG: hypothetical protein NT031_08970 [Planctomycetota bacterium]|nr:hypothetical protein [Planctomycetota bacterium]